MELKIRQARESDLQGCADIVVEEFNKQGEGFTPETARGRVHQLYEMNPDLCFCLELSGKMIGLIFCERFNYAKGNYMWISEFVIKEDYQGKGYGKKTLEFIMKVAKEKRVGVIQLQTREDGKALKIYEKFGFKKTGFINLEKEIK